MIKRALVFPKKSFSTENKKSKHKSRYRSGVSRVSLCPLPFLTQGQTERSHRERRDVGGIVCVCVCGESVRRLHCSSVCLSVCVCVCVYVRVRAEKQASWHTVNQTLTFWKLRGGCTGGSGNHS